MNFRFLLLTGLLVFSAHFLARAGGLERVGHTTLVPRHTNPDGKGMYASVIDPVNGYAYFVGSYLFKVDIMGALPAQVGPALFTGQFAGGAIDPVAGYAYFPGASIKRFTLGAGSTPVSEPLVRLPLRLVMHLPSSLMTPIPTRRITMLTLFAPVLRPRS